MDKYSNIENLISFGKENGYLWDDFLDNGIIIKNGRSLIIWEENEIFHYNLQGEICTLPKEYEQSKDIWNGIWSETGSIKGLEEMFLLIKYWLHDKKEISDLPIRVVRSKGIGTDVPKK